MAKTTVGVYLDEQLVERLDAIRREKGVKEQKDVSRSEFITQLVEKALKSQK
jgi:metal-responsive CopG/Arc/MetJ family transcriptional regulator